jgi:hypothetical protein
MRPFNLLSLPEALARVIFVVWFDLKHVASLDSAICCRDLRIQFARLVYGQSTTYYMDFSLPLESFKDLLRWAISRGALFDDLCLCERTTSTEESMLLLETFLATSGSAIHLVCVSFESSSFSVAFQKAFLLVAKLCPNVTHFHGECRHLGLQWNEHLVPLNSACWRLKSLLLDGMKLSEQSLAEALRHCISLKYLEVRTEDQAIPVEVAIPSLKSLKSCSRCMSDAVLIAIGRRCVNLKTLLIFESLTHFTSDYTVTNNGVRAILQGCPLLRETDVTRAAGVTADVRLQLMKRCTTTKLFPGCWPDMENDLLQELLKVSPHVTELSFGGCEWLTDATLTVCAQHCPQLRELTLWECPHVTAEGMRALVIKLGGTLRSIAIRLCPQLGDEVVLAVAEHCPLLEHFYPPTTVSDAAVAKLKGRCVNLRVYRSTFFL